MFIVKVFFFFHHTILPRSKNIYLNKEFATPIFTNRFSLSLLLLSRLFLEILNYLFLSKYPIIYLFVDYFFVSISLANYN